VIGTAVITVFLTWRINGSVKKRLELAQAAAQ
jgi:hypothetical protein